MYMACIFDVRVLTCACVCAQTDGQRERERERERESTRASDRYIHSFACVFRQARVNNVMYMYMFCSWIDSCTSAGMEFHLDLAGGNLVSSRFADAFESGPPQNNLQDIIDRAYVSGGLMNNCC